MPAVHAVPPDGYCILPLPLAWDFEQLTVPLLATIVLASFMPAPEPMPPVLPAIVVFRKAPPISSAISSTVLTEVELLPEIVTFVRLSDPAELLLYSLIPP